MTMKKNVFLFTLLLPLFALGQPIEGVVNYEQKINMHLRLEGNEDLKSQIPEFQTSNSVLYFKDQESFYTAAKEDTEEEVDDDGNGMVRIRMSRSMNEFYRDFANKKGVDLRDFTGKKYLIEKELEPIGWKLTGESKSIQGYPCQKATFHNEQQNQDIEAWFTPNIPCPSGPETFGQLPGLILELSIDKGSIIYVATKVELKKLEANAIQVPDTGKKISEKKFNQMMEDRMREMNGNGSGGHSIRIIRG